MYNVLCIHSCTCTMYYVLIHVYIVHLMITQATYANFLNFLLDVLRVCLIYYPVYIQTYLGLLILEPEMDLNS